MHRSGRERGHDAVEVSLQIVVDNGIKGGSAQGVAGCGEFIREVFRLAKKLGDGEIALLQSLELHLKLQEEGFRGSTERLIKGEPHISGSAKSDDGWKELFR